MKFFIIFMVIPLFCFSDFYVIHHRNKASEDEIEVWKRISKVKDILLAQDGDYIFVFDDIKHVEKSL
jgi:hypothetical protein